jgi:hypothetical protein
LSSTEQFRNRRAAAGEQVHFIKTANGDGKQSAGRDPEGQTRLPEPLEKPRAGLRKKPDGHGQNQIRQNHKREHRQSEQTQEQTCLPLRVSFLVKKVHGLLFA